MKPITYKGYEAAVAFDAEAGIFHGEVANLRDTVTFQGRTVEELAVAMRESIEDYLDFWRQRDDTRVVRGSGNVFADMGFESPETERELARRLRETRAVALSRDGVITSSDRACRPRTKQGD